MHSAAQATARERVDALVSTRTRAAGLRYLHRTSASCVSDASAEVGWAAGHGRRPAISHAYFVTAAAAAAADCAYFQN